MIEFKYNDGGRKAAGYKGDTGDCVCRAVSIITGCSGDNYKKWYKLLANLNRKRYGKRSARNGIHKADYEKAFRLAGLCKVKKEKGPCPTYTEAFERYGDCIVSTTHHLCAIVDGKLQDTADTRTYEWQNELNEEPETRERKARSVWVPASALLF